MDEYDPITVELRSYIRRETSTTDTCWWTATDTHAVLDLCDNIDAVHAELERDYKTACEVNERQDADYARLKAERDSMAAALDAAQGEHAYAPESHYMLLPKDADGVPIHVGDRLRNDSGKEVTVVGVGDGTFFTFFCVGVNHAHYAADFRHAKPDSWERIIEDAVNVHGNGFNPCWTGERDALVARCKALAGES